MRFPPIASYWIRDAIDEAIHAGRALESADRCAERAAAIAAEKPAFERQLRRHAEQYRTDAERHRLAAQRCGWRALGYSEAEIVLVMAPSAANDEAGPPTRGAAAAE